MIFVITVAILAQEHEQKDLREREHERKETPSL